MKLHIAGKNTTFALDIDLSRSVLTYSMRSVTQRLQGESAAFFDELKITEWRGDFGVYGEPLHTRTIDLTSLKNSQEFHDHASFMLYAPVGFAAEGTREVLFGFTPNLYVMTLASKTDAQQFHATVVQAHPFGHVLVPFAESPLTEWSIGVNVYDPVLIKATGDLVMEPCVTLAVARAETLPVVRFVGNAGSVAADGQLELTVRLETPDGEPITNRNCEVFLESTAGYLSARRVRTINGVATVIFMPDGLRSGESAKVKAGFKYFTGTDDFAVTVK